MQLDPHVDQVRTQLAAAAALGDERTRQIADGLATAAAPAVRLAILDALSAAAEEITAGLLDHPGSPAVSVRLEADEVVVSVTAARADTTHEAARREDSDASARISLRLSESLKGDIDAAADRDGVSVNAWLVRAAAAAVARGTGVTATANSTNSARRVTGWING